jgi:hypothetical protein
MALGGGTFLSQNKVLPGAYINFVSVAKASAELGERGYAAVGLSLDWGAEDKIIEVSNEDFQTDCMKLFGYDYTSDKLKYLRELFLNASTVYCYRLNGGGTAAENKYAKALYSGVRGNDITICIEKSVDGGFSVVTKLDGEAVDTQSVNTAEELEANDYVSFITSAELAEEAGIPLTGGENGTVTGLKHQEFLDKAEAYSYNVLACPTTDDEVKALYIAYTKRMRDDVGAKMQCVVYNKAADHEGVINVKNSVTDENEAALVYWVAGLMAGCEINKSALNRAYDGELAVNADYTQSQLKSAIANGEFTLHSVSGTLRVLADINSLVTYSDTKSDVFADNQTVRVCDRIANDIATIFNTRYLGVVPNDNAGRMSLWNDIVKHHQQLNDIRAIEDFDEDDITVARGDSKRAVVINDAVSIVSAMGKLYMTVTVE